MRETVSMLEVPIVAAAGLGRRSPDGAGWLLREIDLEVSPGDRAGLAGPDAAGAGPKPL